MKRILLTFTLGLLYFSSLGQAREIYLDDDLNTISKSKFDFRNEQYHHYNLRLDLDTLIVNIKVQRIKKGKISKMKLDSIRNELFGSTNKKIERDNILVINYYPGLDKCNSSGDISYVKEKYKRYLKELGKIENIEQFFIYKSSDGTKRYGKKLKWFPDKSNIIEKTFFPIHYPCGSFVIIDLDGSFYLMKGEHNIYDIIFLLKDKKTTFANNLM
ncbi:MAG: hypothetical protein KAH68_06140 [Draconibacterium sp.]|nr:hypothetical protein [Draconibacterium sp.]